MGTTYDTERVNETVVLLHQARNEIPAWVGFQVDDPVTLKRIVHWCLTNAASPLEWQRDGKALYRSVIEWRTPNGGWSANVGGPAVVGDVGRRGRLRLRQPRHNAVVP